jgi:hypothetical protein
MVALYNQTFAACQFILKHLAKNIFPHVIKIPPGLFDAAANIARNHWQCDYLTMGVLQRGTGAFAMIFEIGDVFNAWVSGHFAPPTLKRFQHGLYCVRTHQGKRGVVLGVLNDHFMVSYAGNAPPYSLDGPFGFACVCQGREFVADDTGLPGTFNWHTFDFQVKFFISWTKGAVWVVLSHILSQWS